MASASTRYSEDSVKAAAEARHQATTPKPFHGYDMADVTLLYTAFRGTMWNRVAFRFETYLFPAVHFILLLHIPVKQEFFFMI